jgi:hypothetical protein
MSIVVIMSHGNKESVYSCDGEELDRNWIVKQFTGNNCPSLHKKPKLFIFQACRLNENGFTSKLFKFWLSIKAHKFL